MKSQFESNQAATRRGHLRVNLTVLREMLRLPSDVIITGVRDLDNTSCEICIAGHSLPAEGELTAEYSFQNYTNVTFKGFLKP